MKTDLNIIYWYACFGASELLIELLKRLKEDSKQPTKDNIQSDINLINEKFSKLAFTINRTVSSMELFIIECEQLKKKWFSVPY